MSTTLPALDINQIKDRMLAMPQAPCPVVHRFAPGMYIREIHIPAGTLLMGHLHRFPQLNIFIQGKMLMLAEDGSTKEIAAPQTFMGVAGRKIGYAIEDVIWQNIFVTEETDIDKLEDLLVDKEDTPVPQKLIVGESNLKVIHDAYYTMLKEIDDPQGRIKWETESQIPMPEGWVKTCVRKSDIDGRGLFATCPFSAGEVIAPAQIGDKQTPAGRYTNHSPTPNADMLLLSGDLVLVANKPISGCLGGGPGEEVTVDYRKVLKFRNNKEVQECQ
ncbi:MAG: hypothetical protein WCS15_07595 [Prevotella sp.]